MGALFRITFLDLPFPYREMDFISNKMESLADRKDLSKIMKKPKAGHLYFLYRLKPIKFLWK
jgi:hypothetical protein